MAIERVVRYLVVAALAASGSSFGQVYKCVGPDGTIEFSNLGCAAAASARPVQAKPNSLDTAGSREQALKFENSRLRDQLASQRAAQQLPQTGGDGAPRLQRGANTCPTDQEIRNMETSASSIILGRKERAFLEDEIRRARQCRKGQGNYSADDWRISREAQADQRSITDKARGRTRAEGMHSAADPIEGDRIEQRKLLEAATRARTAQSLIVNCDSAGCINAAGERFNSAGISNTYVGPRGACTRVGQQLICP